MYLTPLLAASKHLSIISIIAGVILLPYLVYLSHAKNLP